jgi:hypothetical protein
MSVQDPVKDPSCHGRNDASGAPGDTETTLPIYRNFLLISGTDRNVGKTRFACKLIEKFSRAGVTGLKISPHWHIPDLPENILYQDDRFMVMEEKNTDGHKDSSKMLVCGARKVYYVQATDGHLEEAFNYLVKNIIGDEPVVCESAALRQIIRPAAHFRVTRDSGSASGDSDQKIPVTFLVRAHDEDFNFNLDRIELSGHGWLINESAL